MQLNNTNGKVIIINEIYVNSNRIDYTLYEYGGSTNYEKKTHIFDTITLKDSLNTSTNYYELCYNTLAMEVGGDWLSSDDIQNWIIDLGSTNEPTIMRVYVPSYTLNEVLNSGNDLDILLKSMAPLSLQAVRLQYGSHQYLQELLTEHRTILETYPEIIIEDRI